MEVHQRRLAFDDVRFGGVVGHLEVLPQLEQALHQAGCVLELHIVVDQPVLDEDQRVAGLSRLWSEAKFNFASFDLVPDLDWDALYIATLPEVRAAASTQATPSPT